MSYRYLQNLLLLSVACLLAFESGQIRDLVRHDTSNGYSAEVAEEVDGSDCGTDSIAICDTAFVEIEVVFGKPCDRILIPDSFYEGPPLFLRGPPLS
ncbi:hypothetical protein [Bythopirellula polymerisocia]|uniref:Uncharacterized protein n=1 Tax=Bythopirellula polymerisocia TaxID=2528003 RepID=A0A5C6C8E0_9BACT|nr:hypothetical protein [Bythopirellula polymerisocia]TWU20365.1 hypothetical protein Pla144_49400 [Bythopirellula polymerisocia]